MALCVVSMHCCGIAFLLQLLLFGSFSQYGTISVLSTCSGAGTARKASLEMQERIDEVKGALQGANVTCGGTRAEPKDLDTYDFKKDPKDFNVYWDVRKGLIPIVGGARETGGLSRHPARCLAAYLTFLCLPACAGSIAPVVLAYRLADVTSRLLQGLVPS